MSLFEEINSVKSYKQAPLPFMGQKEDKDKINVTAFPTTQVNKIVSGGSLGDTTNRQALNLQDKYSTNTANMSKKEENNGKYTFKHKRI